MAKFNYYFGASASALLLAVLVIAAELISPFKNFLKAAFTHHWIGKGVIITLAFVIFGFLFKDKDSIAKLSSEKIAWYSTIGSLAAILLFYIMEFFSR